VDAHSNASWLVFMADEVVDEVEFLAQRVAKDVRVESDLETLQG
jgi:hypothetical protein